MRTIRHIRIFCILFSIFTIAGCRELPEIYCNHNLEKDSLSFLNYEEVHLPNGILKLKNFQLDSNAVPLDIRKIEDKNFINLFNNNIIINGYKQLSGDLKSIFPKTDFITKLLLQFNKNTKSKPDQFRPISYQQYLSDSSFLENEYYYCGQLEIWRNIKSYIFLNHRHRNSIEGIFFIKEETRFFLINLDLSNKLISTIQLAYFSEQSDGLSQFKEKLEGRIILKSWLFYKQSWNIRSLDLTPPAVNSRRKKFLLRINKNGEIK